MEKRYCVLVACMMAFLCLLFACQKDDAMIKDFSEMFDSEKDEENQ